MKKLIVLLTCIIFFQQFDNKAFSQSSWTQVIYDHDGITVELFYNIYDPCNNGKPSRFNYKIKGTPKGYDYYLNWKMDYYNCNNQLIRQTNFLNLNEFVSGSTRKSDNWTFDGSRIATYYDSVYTSTTPDQTTSYLKTPPRSEPVKSIAGNLNIDYGDQTSLSQRGGMLGTNARWKWYTNSCGGNPVDEGETIYVSPKKNTEYFVRAEGGLDGNTPCYSVRVVVNRESRPPNKIDGRKLICRNEATTLSVNGGKLGEGADWVWYQNNLNGKPIGNGPTLTVSPAENATYLVRAEGAVNTTAERSVEVKVVNDKLQDPVGIQGEDHVCSGNDFKLLVTGGHLSEGAEWFWYRNGISAGNLVGKGESLITKSYGNATYYVRGEGVCKTTSERSISITVNKLSLRPNDITGTTGHLSRRKATLQVSGGLLGNGATWKWYKNNCDGRSIHTGETLTRRPKKETTYYVRAEGDCNVTSCASATVTPNRNLKHFFINFGVIPGFHETTQKSITDRVADDQVLGVTLGVYRRSGWYLRGKYSLKNQSPKLTIKSGQIVDPVLGNYYVFDGNVATNRWGATGGLITKLNKNSLFFQLGGGYGQRDLIWKTNAYSNQNNKLQGTSWGKVSESSFAGIELETGLMFRVLIFNIMVGGNLIIPLNNGSQGTEQKKYKNYGDAYVGFGFTF